ncbi:hypothetical protein RSOLAG22IIIB_08364 [Rhizoctonia solani]|uniref:Ricin B lectin domain-containing protein n=1 Tax=Rhizoctonia solani TaxID=456999 RepID=A0A0K6FTA3_9AGAM|nr:hypothetical protein RSOLAG22IIIB_08364 [Rhizoctonia solani]
MGIEPGVYNINSANNGYAVMMYGNDAEGIPMVGVDGANGQTQFIVQEARPGSNTYTVKSTRYKYNIGADKDNLQQKNFPFTVLGTFEWAIEPAGPDLYKIHIPNMNAYWFLPDGPSQTRVLIKGSEGRPEEVWEMIKVD